MLLSVSVVKLFCVRWPSRHSPVTQVGRGGGDPARRAAADHRRDLALDGAAVQRRGGEPHRAAGLHRAALRRLAQLPGLAHARGCRFDI